MEFIEKQPFLKDPCQLICRKCKKASGCKAEWELWLPNVESYAWSANRLKLSYTCRLCNAKWMAGEMLPLDPTPEYIEDAKYWLYRSLIYLHRDKKGLPKYGHLPINPSVR